VGAPFTLASYMIEGGPSKTFLKTKKLMYADETMWRRLMGKLVDVLGGFANLQVGGGAKAIQVFDSWVGALSPEDYVRYVQPYSRALIERIRTANVPVIHFGTGAAGFLRELHAAGGDVAKVDITALVRPAWFVPDTTPLYDQLKAFRHRKTPFALVVDEYGELEGLVTLEDIIEEIVGDISDEHDIAVPGVRALPDGSVNVDGAVPVRDLNRAMDWNIPDDEATTIAGVVIHEARSIPEPGQSFTFHGFRFHVLRRTRNRITSLRVTPLVRKVTAKAG